MQISGLPQYRQTLAAVKAEETANTETLNGTIQSEDDGDTVEISKAGRSRAAEMKPVSAIKAAANGYAATAARLKSKILLSL